MAKSEPSGAAYKLSSVTCILDPDELDIPSQLWFPDRPDSKVHVRIRQVNAGFFELFSRHSFNVGARVQLLFRGEVVNGEVMYERPKTAGYTLGIDCAAPHTLRRQLRYPVDMPALLKVSESNLEMKVRILDMSPSGMGFAAPMEVPIGAGVSIETQKGTVFGEVRHCVPFSGHFRLGIAAL